MTMLTSLLSPDFTISFSLALLSLAEQWVLLGRLDLLVPHSAAARDG